MVIGSTCQLVSVPALQLQVGLGGDFPYIHSAECQQQLRDYSRPGGEYWQEVALAAASAIDTFKSTPELQDGDPTKVVVFDIDETALSNIAAMFEDYAVYESYKQQASAPALGPVLAFYKHLYTSNYSVAFITGRDENARDATAANLLAAGYGSECGTGHSGEVVRSIDGPCYVHLYLRQLNDTRLASVYKPAQRQDLLSKGYSLVGSIGDQFSDLSGGHSADTGFKLPNPFYYIL
jgi:predicted secreted acid phosphatase